MGGGLSDGSRGGLDPPIRPVINSHCLFDTELHASTVFNCLILVIEKHVTIHISVIVKGAVRG